MVMLDNTLNTQCIYEKVKANLNPGVFASVAKGGNWWALLDQVLEFEKSFKKSTLLKIKAFSCNATLNFNWHPSLL